MEHELSKTRLYSIYSGMKRTSNQKVVTAAIQNRPSKALSAPYQACTALPDKDIIHAVTRENRGLWSVCIGILKGRERIVIQFTDFKSGNYHWGLSSNFRVGSNQIPLCSSKRGKPHIFPRKIGVMSVRVQICSRKIPGTGRAVLCFGNV